VVDQERVRPPASEVMALVSDNRAARELCGWRPIVSLEEGLKGCIDFVGKHLARYNPEEYQR
jgi:nucleoside-diphosphate-sugar epimerase